jgi:hypothetical protein
VTEKEDAMSRGIRKLHAQMIADLRRRHDVDITADFLKFACEELHETVC